MAVRVFFSFSSSDITHYYLMKAWKKNPKIDFTFTDYQLPKAIKSEDIPYIKRICKERVDAVSTFVLLIGDDTKSKTTFVKYEVECAVKKGCRLFALNLNNSKKLTIYALIFHIWGHIFSTQKAYRYISLSKYLTKDDFC